MKKNVLVISIVLIFFVSIVICVVKNLFTDGYAYYGDVWFDTPEKALLEAAAQDSETMQILTPQIIFNTTTIDDIVLMTFLSQGDTLVNVTFVTNEDNLYSVSGWTEEWDWECPTEFLMTGDSNQFILIPYVNYGDVICGWCYSTAQFTVNDIVPTRKSFKFESQGEERSIDFWIIDEFTSTDDISIDYLSNSN